VSRTFILWVPIACILIPGCEDPLRDSDQKRDSTRLTAGFESKESPEQVALALRGAAREWKVVESSDLPTGDPGRGSRSSSGGLPGTRSAGALGRRSFIFSMID
jgi:hypothetical protein